MASLLGVLLLVVGLALVIGGAELFFDGLLASAGRWRLSPFVLTVVVSGFELENLAAGVAMNLKGLGNAAAGTFLGGTSFLALAVAGLGAAVAPIRAALPASVLLWSASAPLPLLALGSDGELSRVAPANVATITMAAMAALSVRSASLPFGRPSRSRCKEQV